jgi:hypothetical protein
MITPDRAIAPAGMAEAIAAAAAAEDNRRAETFRRIAARS